MSSFSGIDLINSKIKFNKPISFGKKKKYFAPNKAFSKDEFISSKKQDKTTKPKETIISKIKNRIVEKTGKALQKKNEVLLDSLFKLYTDSYTLNNSDKEEREAFIKELSKLNFNNVSKKLLYIMEEVRNGRNFDPLLIKNILSFENITPTTLRSLKKLTDSAENILSSKGVIYRLELMVYYLNHYSDFDSMSTKKQYDFIMGIEHCFDAESLLALEEDDDLMRFDLIKDIRKTGKIEPFKKMLTEKAKNTPVSFIPVEDETIKSFIKNRVFSYENLKKAFLNADLRKYKKGMPLKYPRADFIKDFKKAIKNLKPEERKEVFKYYQFNIDEDDDIIKYPTPSSLSTDSYSKDVQNAIQSSRKLVEDFMLNNEIQLDRKDKELENILNSFIKVFPEFVSIIGKIQHRGDSIDFHTLDDLKRCLFDPETEKLNKKEQNILFLSVMFHDIAKKQGVVDKGHQKPSAYYAKEILKKFPLDFSEKERIFNLILNSHWTIENNTIYDNALNFRYNNDFKMAQILARADGASAGFSFPVTLEQIQDIQKQIDKINSTGIPLFADNLPDDKSKFSISEEGIKYLDFSDEEADLSQFGFKRGTKVKDLNFLCHNTTNSISEFINLCDDSKDICLSAEYKNASKKGIVTNYNDRYDDNCHVILHCDNENIAAGGINVSCTGGKKGLNEFKNYVFMHSFDKDSRDFKKKLIIQRRSEISNFIKEMAQLDDSEYAEFFNKVNQFGTKDEIEDITLSSDRKLKSEKIKEILSAMQKTILNNKTTEIYSNEIVIFRPKIEAIICDKDAFTRIPLEKSEIKQIAKKHNIPLILV